MTAKHTGNGLESTHDGSSASSNGEALDPIHDGVESLKVPGQERSGGVGSPQERAGRQTNDPLIEDIDEVLETIALLRDLAGDDEEILETESLYKWLTEVVRVHSEEKHTDEAEKRLSNADSETGSNELLENWLADVFVLELAAKIQGRIFVGGADDIDSADTPPPCPYCNNPVGDETDQHVLMCKFAHEEQETMDGMLRPGEEMRGRKGRWIAGR